VEVTLEANSGGRVGPGTEPGSEVHIPTDLARHASRGGGTPPIGRSVHQPGHLVVDPEAGVAAQVVVEHRPDRPGPALDHEAVPGPAGDDVLLDRVGHRPGAGESTGDDADATPGPAPGDRVLVQVGHAVRLYQHPGVGVGDGVPNQPDRL